MPVAGPSNSWDDPSTEPRGVLPVRRDEPIPDDWDDDEDEEEQDDPHKLWEDANKKAPMPQVVIAASATSLSTISPPPAVLQPSIRILKRPSAATSPPATPAADTQQKSFADREAEYQSARERIFGGATAARESSSSSSNVESGVSTPRKGSPGSPPTRHATPASAKIVRHPRGPDTPSDSSKAAVAKGFRHRKPQESQRTS